MTENIKRALLTAGLIASTALLCACEDRSMRDSPVPTPRSGTVQSREAGREVGEAARDAKQNVEEFFGGVRDGYGGSGPRAEPPPDSQLPPLDLSERARVK